IALRDDAAGARCNLAEALFQLGEVDDAVRHFLRVAKEGDAEVTAVALDTLAAIAPGASILDNAGVLALRRAWASRHGKDSPPLAPTRIAQDSARKRRIGYVSAFFGDRNWMKPVFAAINHHDRARFEVHLLSDGDDPSAASGYRDHAEDRIWQTAGLSNAA